MNEVLQLFYCKFSPSTSCFQEAAQTAHPALGAEPLTPQSLRVLTCKMEKIFPASLETARTKGGNKQSVQRVLKEGGSFPSQHFWFLQEKKERKGGVQGTRQVGWQSWRWNTCQGLMTAMVRLAPWAPHTVTLRRGPSPALHSP